MQSLNEKNFLSQAIDHYHAGMRLDLNQFYCSSNLPRLLRSRNRRGDQERADAKDESTAEDEG